MPLTEETFTLLVDRGCPSCSEKRLTIEAIVAQRLPLLEGEPYGSPSWGYKGEELVHGTYRIACSACHHEIYAADACLHCNAAGGVERALGTENHHALPTSCSSCDSPLLTATAWVPAEVLYEGKRAAKARTQTAPEDLGFHTIRVECKSCRKVDPPTVLRDPCPLCGAGG